MTTALRTGLMLLLAICIWQSTTILIAATITRSVALNLKTTAVDTATGRKFAMQRLNTAVRIEPGYATAMLLQLPLAEMPGERLAIATQLSQVGPADPRNWALLCAELMASRRTGPELTAALERAGRTGPYDPVTNHIIIDAGTLAWLYLSSRQRELVMQASVRALESRANYMKQSNRDLMTRRGFIPLACSLASEKIPECS